MPNNRNKKVLIILLLSHLLCSDLVSLEWVSQWNSWLLFTFAPPDESLLHCLKPYVNLDTLCLSDQCNSSKDWVCFSLYQPKGHFKITKIVTSPALIQISYSHKTRSAHVWLQPSIQQAIHLLTFIFVKQSSSGCLELLFFIYMTWWYRQTLLD